MELLFLLIDRALQKKGCPGVGTIWKSGTPYAWQDPPCGMQPPQCLTQGELSGVGVVGMMGLITRQGLKQVQGPSREQQKEMEPETGLETWLQCHGVRDI